MARLKFLNRRQLPDPQPKAGEVLIRVKAIGINFADLLQRMGLYPGTPKPPFVPGLEIAGVVEKASRRRREVLGRRVAAAGRRRRGIPQFNAYAEWVAVPARQVYRLPAGMPFERCRGDSGELPDGVSLDVHDGKFAARETAS